jgi:hypothetical protein
MRIFDIISSELNLEKLKLEEEFERVVNDKNIVTLKKIKLIKNTLKKIALVELQFNKLSSYTKEVGNVDIDE